MSLDRAAALHRLSGSDGSADEAGYVVDDATWSDLDLDAVFVAMNRSVTGIGRQILYRRLRCPTRSPAALSGFESLMKIVRQPSVEPDILAALDVLKDPRSEYLVDVAFGALPRLSRWWFAAPFMSLCSLLTMVIVFSGVWPSAAVVLGVLCVANIALQVYCRRDIAHLSLTCSRISRLAEAIRTLHRVPFEGIGVGGSDLQRISLRLQRLSQCTWWLQFEHGQTNELVSGIVEYINIVLLLNINASLLAVAMLRRFRGDLQRAYTVVGTVDAALSVTAWRSELTQWTTPDRSGAELACEQLLHPLLLDGEPLSISIERSGVVVTGPNMSGKTTFLRMLGLAWVMGQSVNTVCAKMWRAPFVVVRTFIERNDSMLEARSYFLAEAERLLSLIKASEQAIACAFLLDEPFRGTNRVERISAAAATVSFLNMPQHRTVVTTHDTELPELLGDAFDQFFFEEPISRDGGGSPYQIARGVTAKRNAIALLSAIGYPPQIVERAQALSLQL